MYHLLTHARRMLLFFCVCVFTLGVLKDIQTYISSFPPLAYHWSCDSSRCSFETCLSFIVSQGLHRKLEFVWFFNPYRRCSIYGSIRLGRQIFSIGSTAFIWYICMFFINACFCLRCLGAC